MPGAVDSSSFLSQPPLHATPEPEEVEACSVFYQRSEKKEHGRSTKEVPGHLSTTPQVRKSFAFLLRTSKQNTFKDETLKLTQPANYKWDIVQVSLGFSLGNVFLLETTPHQQGEVPSWSRMAS